MATEQMCKAMAAFERTCKMEDVQRRKSGSWVGCEHIYIYIFIYVYIYIFIASAWVLGGGGGVPERRGGVKKIYIYISMYTCVYVCRCARCASGCLGPDAARFQFRIIQN